MKGKLELHILSKLSDENTTKNKQNYPHLDSRYSQN